MKEDTQEGERSTRSGDFGCDRSGVSFVWRSSGINTGSPVSEGESPKTFRREVGGRRQERTEPMNQREDVKFELLSCQKSKVE